MTREEILEMEAGPMLDSLIANKVMGWMIDDESFCPSTDISAAWEVVEKIKSHEHCIEVSWYEDHYNATIIQQNDEEGYRYMSQIDALTAPEAICKAALLAVIPDTESTE